MPPPPKVAGKLLRIGDRVRVTQGDAFISQGQEGLVVNVAPARYGQPVRARILFDSEVVCIMNSTDFTVLEKPQVKAP